MNDTQDEINQYDFVVDNKATRLKTTGHEEEQSRESVDFYNFQSEQENQKLRAKMQQAEQAVAELEKKLLDNEQYYK